MPSAASGSFTSKPSTVTGPSSAIVTGRGLTADGRWRSSRPDFLVPVKALSPIFRAKFRDGLKMTQLFPQVEPRVWRKDAQELIRRFLQHVLPPRFIKVRYYGLLSPAQRQLLLKARQLLRASTPQTKAGRNHGTANHAVSALPSATHTAGSARSQRSRPMKLHSRLLSSSFFSLATGEFLSTSPSHSVCLHKKTSLTGWLSLLQSQHLSPLRSFSPHGTTFPPASLPSVHYSNSK